MTGFQDNSIRNVGKWLAGLLLAALLLSQPQAASRGAAVAMQRWYVTVAPSLFPFLTLMPLLTGPEAAAVYERLAGRFMGILFDLPGSTAAAMMIGMAAGTPAGAVAARYAAEQAGMTRGQLKRLAVAVTGFSPAFLLSGVGSGMLGSLSAGIKLLSVQILTQLTMAVALRRVWRKDVETLAAAHSRRMGKESPVRAAVLAVLTICGYMAFFGSLAEALCRYTGEALTEPLLCVLDAPSGMALIAGKAMSLKYRLLVLSGLCGFGGIGLAVQSLAVLKGCGVRVWEWLALRTMAAAISVAYMAIVLSLTVAGLPNWIGMIGNNPLAAAGLMASILAIPVPLKLRKSIS